VGVAQECVVVSVGAILAVSTTIECARAERAWAWATGADKGVLGSKLECTVSLHTHALGQASHPAHACAETIQGILNTHHGPPFLLNRGVRERAGAHRQRVHAAR